jgi:hypothetical protein
VFKFSYNGIRIIFRYKYTIIEKRFVTLSDKITLFWFKMAAKFKLFPSLSADLIHLRLHWELLVCSGPSYILTFYLSFSCPSHQPEHSVVVKCPGLLAPFYFGCIASVWLGGLAFAERGARFVQRTGS